MQSRITGNTMPVLEIGLEPGETLVAEAGEMAWMTSNMQLRTTTAAAGARGLWGAVKRAVAGGGLFMTEFSPAGSGGGVAFAAKVPGEIVPMTVVPGAGYMVHRHGFLCATQGVELSIGFQQSLGAGLFGGSGFILQRITGSGTAWLELGGEIIKQELAPGEEILIAPGHVGMFEERVSFEITAIRGIANALFGGQGLFLAKLRGPGTVWLQSLTVPGLAHAIAPYLGHDAPNTGSTSVGDIASTAAGVGIAGAVLGSLFGSDDRS